MLEVQLAVEEACTNIILHALHRITHDEIEGPVGGWGIGLIRELMDEIAYERRHGKNILCLVKKRGAQ